MKLLRFGDLEGPWYISLDAFDESSCLLGLSWHRYANRLDVCIHPLPFVTLLFVKRMARNATERHKRSVCLLRCGSVGSPWYFTASILPLNFLTVGATWYRDASSFELCVSPLPWVDLFISHVKEVSR